MPTRAASGSWKYVPENWATRERFTYKTPSAVLGLEFEWELEKIPHSDSAIIRARAVVNIPFRREQRLAWKTRFSGEVRGAFGFAFVEETNEVTGSARSWTAQADKILYSEGGTGQLLTPPAGATVYHPLQVPAFFRSFGATFPSEPLTLLVSRRFQALRAQDEGATRSGHRVRIEVASIGHQGVDWGSAKTGEVLLEPDTGIAKEFRAHIPVIGAVAARLEKREA